MKKTSVIKSICKKIISSHPFSFIDDKRIKELHKELERLNELTLDMIDKML